MALMAEDEVQRRLGERAGWSRADGAIAREVKCGDFSGSVELVNQIAEVADELDHHPDVEISWDTVTLTLSTHSEGGVTAADFELAERIDAIAG